MEKALRLAFKAFASGASTQRPGPERRGLQGPLGALGHEPETAVCGLAAERLEELEAGGPAGGGRDLELPQSQARLEAGGDQARLLRLVDGPTQVRLRPTRLAGRRVDPRDAGGDGNLQL